jgi:23S rRNA pseudouridine2605 synthase
MDDERKKFPRNGGKSAGPRGPRKPGFGDKPRSGGDKPFRKRTPNEAAAGAGDRPQGGNRRDAWRDKGGERSAEAAKPFRKGPPRDGERKPFVKREGFDEQKSFAPRGDGERKPFVKREGFEGKKPYAPRADGERKPFVKREGFEGKKPYAPRGDGERKPYVLREQGAGRPDRPFVKREGGDDRPRKPYVPRERAEGEGFKREFKPRDRDGESRAPREGVRSFGSKSHEGQRRSYGMKSHDERPRQDGERKPFRKRDEAVAIEEGERIAKRLARAGIASRRDAEELIAAGRVSVNGRKLDSPAFNVMPDDRISVDGTEIPAIERTRLFLFNKPAGVVTTNRDPEGRKTVFDVLPTDLPRLMTIGRLDINTEGLLLLTNDGGLSRVLELPATGWLRRYRARVHGKVDEKALAGLKDGIAIDGVFYGSIEASLEREQGSNAWLSIGLREGKNREVKNILGALGLDVTRLIRISYGPFQLGELREGHVLEIKGRMLRDQLGERLIEESGANFEAPVVNAFSNLPVKRETPREDPAERPAIKRDGERGRIGEGGLIKKRQRREGSRDEALGKLSTRPDRPRVERGERPERPQLERGERPERAGKFGDRPDRFASFADKPGPKPRPGKKPEREQRPIDPPGQRRANVWMASGARPIGAGRAAAEKAEVDNKRAAKKAAYGKADANRSFGKPRGDRQQGDGSRGGPQGERPGPGKPGPGKGGPRGSRGRDADRRR